MRPAKYLLALGLLLAALTGAAQAVEKRCGWFVNPTPGNAWLIDRHGEWIIGTQGGHQAEGDWPSFSDAQWVKTNVHYGYGCACLDVEADAAEKRVLRILRAKAKPLKACRSDKTLPEME